MKKHLFILLFYTALTGLALNQLVFHLHEYVGIGDGQVTDYYHNHWNYWWIRHALTTPNLSVYETNYVLFPYDNNLGFHTLAPFWFPLWAILEPITNHLVAMNVVLWVGLILTGYCTYLFLRDQGSSHRFALLGGAMMSVFPHFTWAVAMTLPVYVAGFWYAVPFLLWKRVIVTRKFIWSAALGITFWLMLMTDFSSLLFIAVILAPYAVWTVLTSSLFTGEGVKLFALCLLPFLILLVLGWFIAPLQPMLAFDRDSISPASIESTRLFSMPLTGFLTYSGQGDKAVGGVLMGLTLWAIVAPVQNRQRWLWFWIGLPPMIFCLGPDLVISGTQIPLPYQLVHELTDGIFRAPVRFAPVGVLMWLVFIGQTLASLRFSSTYLPTRGLSPLFSMNRVKFYLSLGLFWLILANLRVLEPFHAGKPIPTPAYYETISQDPEDYVILEVPVSVGSGWIIHGDFVEAQYFGVTHHKRMLNGLIARIPDWEYEFFIHDATIGWLGGFQPFQPEIQRDQLREYIALWNVGYVVVHQHKLNPAAGQAEEIIGFLNSLDYLCPVRVEGDVIFYAARFHGCPPRRLAEIAPQTWQIDFGTVGDEFFIGQGFHRQELIGGPTARWLGARNLPQTDLWIDLPLGEYEISLTAFAFAQNRPLELYLGAEKIAVWQIQTGDYQLYTAHLPRQESENLHFTLVYGEPLSNQGLGLSDDPRPLSLALDKLTFTQTTPAP